MIWPLTFRGHVPDDGSVSESESQESCGYHDDLCLMCGENLSAGRHACASGVGATVGRGRTSPGLKSEDSGSLGDEELHQAQLAAHRAFEALSRQMRSVSVRHSTTSTDRVSADEGRHPSFAGPHNFPDEALPHIALFFCILRA